MAEKYRVPGVERALTLLEELSRQPEGMTIDELARGTRVSRSSVYRILNSLEAYGAVRAMRAGKYVLGGLILKLAASTISVKTDIDLARISLPFLEAAAFATKETAKISVHDVGATLVIAGASGHHDGALPNLVDRYLPLHAGAASKLLLANLSPLEIDAFMRARLTRFTPLTLCDKELLLPELEAIRAAGWSRDRGEYSLHVQSYAAPVSDESGQVVAAVSIPFAARSSQEYHDFILKQTIATAQAITREIQQSHSTRRK